MRRVTGRVAVVVALVAASVVAVVVYRASRPPAAAPTCLVSAPSGRWHLDLEQAANAATIAAVGKRMGLADHAVTIALVAGLQESKLHNVATGDRDSVGLFQQRPSQGWGDPSQLIVPDFAAAAFYTALVKVPDWATMPVGDVAQKVQRSAAPDAYGPWETQGRALAEGFTGEAPAAVSCRFNAPAPAAAAMPFDSAVATELGPPALGTAVSEARGWTVAGWLVAHAYEYRITSVRFLGRLWTPSTGTWLATSPVVPEVQVGLG